MSERESRRGGDGSRAASGGDGRNGESDARSGGQRESATPPDRIVLSEYDTSDPLELSDPALDAIEELNADIGGTRIDVEHHRDGTATLSTSQYVGTVSLPDGPEIRVQPKAAGTNFLALLRWAHGIEPRVHEEQTRAESGRTFVDTLGLLYAAELDSLLTRGPHREYQWTAETESKLRGRLDLQRQLQHQRVTATEFEVVYDELTADTVANRGIQQGGERLSKLVEDRTLAGRLQQQSRQLSRWVGDVPVSPAEIARVETTRLNDHYGTILRLAEQVLRHRYLDEFSPVEQSSFGLMVNMNSVFERAVERTARELAATCPDWQVRTQERIPAIATGGTPAVNMYPDFLLEHAGVPQLVGDAKWKTEVKQSDIYQMSAYVLALDVPGVLVYPEQTGGWDPVETSYVVDDRLNLAVRELPTATDPEGSYPQQLQDALGSAVLELSSVEEWESLPE
jgi:5-methylcytosine-specific restriction enzyme subunit McrC